MNEYQLRNVERFTRFMIGFGIVIAVLIAPLTPGLIVALCALAVYPLMTALVATDPVFFLMEKAGNYFSSSVTNQTKIAY